MKKIIDKMISPIKKDIENFIIFLEQNLHSDVKIINTITKYLIKNRGKQFRSILCLLSSKLTGEKMHSESSNVTMSCRLQYYFYWRLNDRRCGS